MSYNNTNVKRYNKPHFVEPINSDDISLKMDLTESLQHVLKHHSKVLEKGEIMDEKIFDFYQSQADIANAILSDPNASSEQRSKAETDIKEIYKQITDFRHYTDRVSVIKCGMIFATIFASVAIICHARR